DHSVDAVEDTALVIDPRAYVTDIDSPATAIQIQIISGPAHGSLAVNADGSYTYTPSANYFGADSFTYRASDEEFLQSNIATVSITVAAVNDAPVAGDDSAPVAEDHSVTVSVLGNDTDVDNPTLTTALVATAQHGTVVHNADGTFTYTPDANYFGA